MPKTGIVFAGYGASDVRPMYLEIQIGSAFGGIVKHQLVSSGAPDPARTGDHPLLRASRS